MIRISSLIAASALALPTLVHAYTLKDDYTGNNYQDFFNKFSFWTGPDPTEGLVDYVNLDSAWDNGLIGNGGNIYLGVDHTNKVGNEGRKSVRLTGNIAYNPGILLVADITHMPDVCGTWPAFWMTAASDDWPQSGEIDIIEQANNAQNNQMSLHVSNKQGQCIISTDASMTATQDRWGDCAQEATGGCDANDPRTNSFGSGFNNNGGGVYAAEWTSEWVRIWFFPRNEIPGGDTGPLGSAPDPATWGTPTTSFQSRYGTDCDMSSHIRNQRVIIDTTFCGAWASGSWRSSGCAAKTGYDTCESYVKNVPGDFASAFWTFKLLKVFH
ncbi:glycoside hydrolase family 16 protein [Aspergillus clavatus NRRL 1]|uniref:GH16 domain-containing protein n=1 Tax=Aspergillus clavatus (strain ATCC 1007 / CBS 513.65 / DSM 816 / NCTC 3887 / NRRL 1 / QM 1276 / 107) TaxID=344612 RepID=A1CCP0_ASPCL|nr:uncharacterized protein ACLA_062620 [Aspergillus clavatus NRRL 1]EAW12297.1 conserved hypothetical protein [Aspergillus clavatus NRRL 1]